MSGKIGSITTDIIKNGLAFNMDAANRASYIPNATTSFNTIDLSKSGSFVNDPTYISPPTSASCWDFDGTDDYINCGNITILSNATIFTYSGWYKQDTLDVISYMFGSYIDVSNRVFVYTWSNGLLNFQIEKSGTNYYSRFDYSPFVTAGQWFHLAIVYDGSGAANADKVKIYIDGALMTLSFIGTFPSSTPSGTNIATIGKVEDAAQTWNGSISNVQIYSRTLSSTEVLHNYNALKDRFNL